MTVQLETQMRRKYFLWQILGYSDFFFFFFLRVLSFFFIPLIVNSQKLNTPWLKTGYWLIDCFSDFAPSYQKYKNKYLIHGILNQLYCDRSFFFFFSSQEYRHLFLFWICQGQRFIFFQVPQLFIWIPTPHLIFGLSNISSFFLHFLLFPLIFFFSVFFSPKKLQSFGSSLYHPPFSSFF